MLRPTLAHLPEKLQELYEAPAGSVTLFTPDLPDIVGGFLTPSDGHALKAVLLPGGTSTDVTFSTEIQLPHTA